MSLRRTILSLGFLLVFAVSFCPVASFAVSSDDFSELDLLIEFVEPAREPVERAVRAVPVEPFHWSKLAFSNSLGETLTQLPLFLPLLPGESENSRQWTIRSTFELLIEDFDVFYEFTDQQRQKLDLAAGRDRSQLLRWAEKLSDQVRLDEGFTASTHEQCWLLRHRIEKGIYGPDSLFTKTLNLILTREQQTIQARVQPLWQIAVIHRVLNTIQFIQPLQPKERAALIQLIKNDLPAELPEITKLIVEQENSSVGPLSEELDVPHEMAIAAETLAFQQERRRQDQMEIEARLIMYRLGSLREREIEQILNPDQWEWFQPRLKGFRRLGIRLTRQGLLPDPQESDRSNAQVPAHIPDDAEASADALHPETLDISMLPEHHHTDSR